MRPIDSSALEQLRAESFRPFYLLRLQMPTGDEQDENLVGYWSFDDGSGTVARDSSGNGNDGTLHNMEDADWVDGVSGKCLSFDGDDDYVDLNAADVLSGATEGSISAWVYANNWDANRMTVFSTETGAAWASLRFVLFTHSDSSLTFSVADGTNSTQDTCNTGTGLPSETWLHVVGTFDGSNVKIYINGEEKASISSSITPGTFTPTFTGIGWHYDVRYWNGLIDEVRIYNKALTAQEVKALYRAPGERRAYTTCDVPIVYDSIRYEPLSFEVGSASYGTSNILDSIKLRVDNTNQVFSSYLVGETVQSNECEIFLVLVGDDNQPLANSKITVFKGSIDSWELDEEQVSMTISTEFAWDLITTARQTPSCRWKRFKGSRCKYSGSETWCDRSYARCQALGNTANFGGFRFLPDLELKEVWWGKKWSEFVRAWMSS